MINLPDFKSIKRGMKLETVLRHYHVKLRRSGKDQYRGCCPIHRGDGRDAFHVNLARNGGSVISRLPTRNVRDTPSPGWQSL